MNNKNAKFAGEVWQRLSKINVNDHTEMKGNLTYLSWSWAWATLMENYPNSAYKFHDPVTFPDGSVEIWVTLIVADEDNSVTRDMWLPVMNHRMQAIKHPDARMISDTRMRALTKCLAMVGLGHYIYAGESTPSEYSPAPADPANYREIIAAAPRSDNGKPIIDGDTYVIICQGLAKSIAAVKAGVDTDDANLVAETIAELEEDEFLALWRAPSKGGCWTKEERDYIQSQPVREAIAEYKQAQQ